MFGSRSRSLSPTTVQQTQLSPTTVQQTQRPGAFATSGSLASTAMTKRLYAEGSSEPGDSPSNSSPGARRSTTSATSPLPSEGLNTPLPKAPVLSNDGLTFRSDLSNYLALGCLCFEDESFIKGGHEAYGWHDLGILAPPPIPWADAILFAYLSKLVDAGWIKLQTRRSTVDPSFIIWRVYILPGDADADAGHRSTDQQNKKLWSALENLLAADIDVSTETWQGHYTPQLARKSKFDPWAQRVDGSLFYMFNTLASPSPVPQALEDQYAYEALEDLLQSVLPGLKTVLYPYQRRSAGVILQRESVVKLELDPRLEERTAPDGSTYYYGPRDLLFFRQPRYYKACQGGILAETMGLGKTVILLSVILATKNHPPKMPTRYFAISRPTVGSLADMATSAVYRKSLPWKVELDRIRHANGNEMKDCVDRLVDRLEQSPPSYCIPVKPQRWNRKTVQPPPKKVTLACTTLIIVPRNLLRQWQSEIEKHVESEMLSILVMEDLKRALPPPEELRAYDVVLFSRNRFETEIRDGSDEQGRRIGTTQQQLVCRCPYIGATRTKDCNCVRSDDLYDSPLKHLHFKRLIIDEGHFFSNNNSTAVTVANKLITADHRWVVSGTPAKDLLGVEVDVFATEALDHRDRDAVLDQRREFNAKEDTAGAVKSLASLAASFLKIEPWYAVEIGEAKASWDEYMYRHESLRKRTYSGFSSCLRRTLEAMVIKTQPEDVERDIRLPPLSHEIIRLEPSFYDKLTANLFTLVLTANAVTSERTDIDYVFHKNSAKARYQLISNLRQSAFFWTGFSEADVVGSIKNGNSYLAKKYTACPDGDRSNGDRSDGDRSDGDRRLLTEMLAWANTVSASAGWKAMSRSHELGLFVDEWPAESAEHWAFDESHTPLLTGVSQLLEAQKHVNQRSGPAGAVDPGEGLAGVGIRVLAPARHGTATPEDSDTRKAEKPALAKSGIPASSLSGEPTFRRRSSMSGKSKLSPKKVDRAFKVIKPQKRRSSNQVSLSAVQDLDGNGADIQAADEAADEAIVLESMNSKKRKRSEIESAEFAEGSPYPRSRIIGTTSAKLSYLVSQILKYYKDEKILIFYEGDNVAYYIAQTLELLHIKHEIYAKSLAAHLKSEYVVRFDQEAQDRVLLMDVKQAAFGLNLSSASRIYFVNPVCRPNVEAQAIKRAHRIGQTRKVYVETLVLKGTIEEKMFERAKRMTRSEHLTAKVLEDDGGIREIIQSARLLPVKDEEKSGYGQVALLGEAQQLWGRPGWHETVGYAAPARPSAKRQRQRPVMLNDVTNPEEDARVVYDEEDARVVYDDNAAKRVGTRAVAFLDCTNPAAGDSASGAMPMQPPSRKATISFMLDETLPVGESNKEGKAHAGQGNMRRL
ncbi:hypothetical protein LTR08_001750 [Meristemomyces frigidus]|nr:hypothetical protein LTR08_001750 [Meristemomyces frigidus]